jgi:hypothetical protein
MTALTSAGNALESRDGIFVNAMILMRMKTSNIIHTI